jgi:hypothetical protein
MLLHSTPQRMPTSRSKFRYPTDSPSHDGFLLTLWNVCLFGASRPSGEAAALPTLTGAAIGGLQFGFDRGP